MWEERKKTWPGNGMTSCTRPNNKGPVLLRSQQVRTILEVYNSVMKVMRVLGSSSYILFVPNESEEETTTNKREEPLFTFVTGLKCMIIYYTTKVCSFLHTLFFVVRFFNMMSCDETNYQWQCGDKGVLLLAISCYIWSGVMVHGIFVWFHVKRAQISRFFGKLNVLDNSIFGEDVKMRLEYVSRHEKVFNRVKFYVPTTIAISIVLIGLNHANHPRFLAHFTSLFFTESDTFFKNEFTTTITIVSFLLEFFLVLYFYLALYQFLFIAVTTARSFEWCLEPLTSSSDRLLQGKLSPEMITSLVESNVEKFERIRALMTEYNGVFSGLTLFCKAILVIQITIFAYIPLKRVNVLPFSSLMIFMAVATHYAFQLVMLLPTMGRVLKRSSEFRELWLRNLHKAYSRDRDDDDETKIKVVRYNKMLLETCTPFGFECGGCYVVTTNTILTFFSIVTSYLIVMLQLHI